MAAQLHGARIGLQLSFKYRTRYLEERRNVSEGYLEQGLASDQSFETKVLEPELDSGGKDLMEATNPICPVLDLESGYVSPSTTLAKPKDCV